MNKTFTVKLTVDENNQLTYDWWGNIILMPNMIGSLEIAKQELVYVVSESSKKPQKKQYKVLKRDEAINNYLDKIAEIKNKINEIKNLPKDKELKIY